MNREIVTFACEGSLIRMPDTATQIQRDNYLKKHFQLGEIVTQKLKAAAQKAAESSGGSQEGAEGTGEERWRPKPEDLIRVPFRALSETIVAGGTWRATDFTKPGVLKAAQGLIVGKPAYTDHFQWGDNFVGVIETSAYSIKRQSKAGFVPAGIDIVYLINAKQNERLAGGLLMTPPAIFSNSVTVEFEWEPSHTFENPDDFLRNIGKIGADGKMVTRVATKIIDFHESSILFMGADPYAKMLDAEGNPMQVERGSTFDESTKYAKELYTQQKKFYVSHSFSKEGINLTAHIEEQIGTDMDKKLEALAKKALGLAENEAITEAQLSSVKVVKAEEYTALEKSKTDLEAEVAELKKTDATKLQDELKKAQDDVKTQKAEAEKLKQEKAALEPLAEVGKGQLEAKRKATEELYRKTVKAPSEAVLNLIKDADAKVLDGLLAQYTAGVTEKFSGRCTKCNSEEFEFRSTLHTGEEGGGGNDTNTVSDEEYRKAFRYSD